MTNNPHFKITHKILGLIQDIAHTLGILSGAKLGIPPVRLRKNNQVKTIQSSLAIEGNTLTLEQITDIIDGKRVLAPRADVIEVNNAIKLYNNLGKLDPLLMNSLLEAHRVLMEGLTTDNGVWRSQSVGIFRGSKITHLAPLARRVPSLMEGLFLFTAENNDVPWLLKACIFHYELEFIHPFSDGNGRIGRLWQQLLLMKKVDPIFEFIPVETLVKDNQEQYYSTLSECDKLGESTLFIEFMGEQILNALQFYTKNTTSTINTPEARLQFAKEQLQDKWFTRKDYILLHKDISTATASRDLLLGVKEGRIICQGDKNQTQYRFNYKSKC